MQLSGNTFSLPAVAAESGSAWLPPCTAKANR